MNQTCLALLLSSIQPTMKYKKVLNEEERYEKKAKYKMKSISYFWSLDLFPDL